MAEITLSKAVRSNLLSLQNTAVQLGKTQERLATGLKVNSALDNPTNFFTASSLNSRASDLGQLLDSVSNAVQTIEAADNGITAITNLVESAQATARQALQTAATVEQTTTTAATAGTLAGGAFSAVDVSGTGSAATAGSVSATFGSALTFDDTGDTLTFDIAIDGGSTASITIDQSVVSGIGNNDNVIDDENELAAAISAAIDAEGTYTSGADLTVSAAGGDVTITSGTTGSSSSIDISNVAVNDNGGADTITNTSGLGTDSDTGAAAVAADAISFDLTVDGGSATTITIDDAAVTQYNTDNGASLDSSALTADDIVALINDQAGATIASNNGGNVDLTSTTTGASSSVAVASYSASVTGGSTGISNGSNTGADETSTTTDVANPKRDELVTQYNELLTQIDDLAKDASFNGVNLLDGDSLSVLFNEDGSSSLDIGGVTYSSSGLGLSEVASGGFDDDADINSTLDTLKSGIETLRTQSSKFGSNLSVVEIRQNFTKDIINTLETGAANLTLADSNEEAANLLALQTRQQLSSTALSLASQADQNVLRLL
ncbi:flagellin N-terminal helical domain-containing protein [Cucumibacter marinus]|uniref:flagellin N-terminal helical domain-containing protein n=1 Tax=Cucumibacter marinus TaxID=1121252 RepID=UPI00042114B5|nr:flagellin [Cucumibacter marinus]